MALRFSAALPSKIQEREETMNDDKELRDLDEAELLTLLPKELAALDMDAEYRLTKVEAFHDKTMVYTGDTVVGSLDFVQVPTTEKVGVRVFRSFSQYIRTSPVVKVLDATEGTVTFQTEGGVYKIERGASQ